MRKLCVVELLNSNRIEAFRCTFMWRIIFGTRISFHGDTRLDGHGEEIKKIATELAASVGAVNIGDFIPCLDWLDLQGVKRRMKKAHKSIDQVISKLIEEHQRRKRKLQKQNDEQQLATIVFDIFVAGIETTSTTLAWAMSVILKNPHVAEKMQEEIESVVGRERTVSELDLGSMESILVGYFIPERSRLIINVWAIGRDPSLWEDPLAFKPERFMGKNVDIVRDKNLFDMLPFGAGRRGCPGAGMAIVTINLVLAQLIHCFEWDVEGDLDMTEVFGTTITRSVDLLARPALRLTSYP
ncbi:hypothetical protein SUGI_1007060 [Cryptomeria japonica]|nr:hypothetical protein SUGI_1007060 [Cryptomeria japonica]